MDSASPRVAFVVLSVVLLLAEPGPERGGGGGSGDGEGCGRAKKLNLVPAHVGSAGQQEGKGQSCVVSYG